MASEKLDLYKLHKDQYITPKKPEMVKTKPAKYLTITGKGEPGVELFSRKIQALPRCCIKMRLNQLHTPIKRLFPPFCRRPRLRPSFRLGERGFPPGHEPFRGGACPGGRASWPGGINPGAEFNATTG
jgi:hypothetical protein